MEFSDAIILLTYYQLNDFYIKIMCNSEFIYKLINFKVQMVFQHIIVSLIFYIRSKT